MIKELASCCFDHLKLHNTRLYHSLKDQPSLAFGRYSESKIFARLAPNDIFLRSTIAVFSQQFERSPVQCTVPVKLFLFDGRDHSAVQGFR